MYSICYSIDDRYAELAAVSMKSIEMFGECPDVEFIVAGRNLSKKTKAMIRSSVLRPVKIQDVGHSFHNATRKFRVSNSNWSQVIFYRFQLAETSCSERILYLDADTMVTQSLQPLLNREMDGHLIAAVEERDTARHNRMINRPIDTPYFNSGVMLIDVEQWRKSDALNRLMKILAEDEFAYPDQDALNILVEGEFKSIESSWNAGHWVDDTSDSAVVHFTKIKPNNKRSIHPQTATWRRIRLETAWRGRSFRSNRTPMLRKLTNSIARRFLWLFR